MQMTDKSVLSSLQCIVAPMVSQSDAPFRTLCLKYGATASYTEMLYTDKVVADQDYLNAYLPHADHTFFGNQYASRPLVVQVCGNDPAIMAKAVTLIATKQIGVDAIDINLGCPQDRARDGLFGSFLLDKQHWDRVFACVKSCSEALTPHNTPLFCKIRLIEGADPVELTTNFCRGLILNGCKAICIHGRTRGSTKKRRCGPADLAAIATIAQTIRAEFNGSIPVISNGNITTTDDVYQALKEAHPCCGVMSAEGILANPALFLGVTKNPSSSGSAENASTDVPASGGTAAAAITTGKRTHASAYETSLTRDDLSVACAEPTEPVTLPVSPQPSRLALFQEYCALSEQYRLAGGWEKLDAHFARPKIDSTSSTAAGAVDSVADSSSGAIEGSLCSKIENAGAEPLSPAVVGLTAGQGHDKDCGVSSALAPAADTTVSTSTYDDHTTAPCACTHNSVEAKERYIREPRQIYIARQHLSWMLGKSGHGRMVRYAYIGPYYKKHVHLMQDMNAATSVEDLLCIAERCLPC